MNIDTLITTTYSNAQVDKSFLDCVYEECGAEQPNITHPVLVFSIYWEEYFFKTFNTLEKQTKLFELYKKCFNGLSYDSTLDDFLSNPNYLKMFWTMDYYLNDLFTHNNDESESKKIKFKKNDVLHNCFSWFDKENVDNLFKVFLKHNPNLTAVLTVEEIAKRRLYIKDGLLTMVDGQTVYPNAPFSI